MEGSIRGTFETLTQHLSGNTKKEDEQPAPVASRERGMSCNHSTAKSDHRNYNSTRSRDVIATREYSGDSADRLLSLSVVHQSLQGEGSGVKSLPTRLTRMCNNMNTPIERQRI
jgi:hypothetical protein